MELRDDRITVRRSALTALLLMVDTGGFWSRDLGIAYRPGEDTPGSVLDDGDEAVHPSRDRVAAALEEARTAGMAAFGTAVDAVAAKYTEVVPHG